MKTLGCVLAMSVLVVGCGGGEMPEAEPEAAAYSPTPYASLADVMRGIPFPNSNIIFDTQDKDPEAPSEAAESGGAGATATYSNVYGGWQSVELAARALQETANLILVPGRMCENGLPVPLENEDFQMFAQGLVDAGNVAYEAAQNRDLDAMIDVAGAVSDACFFCHEIYRDKPEGEMRCVPGEPAF